MESASIEWYGWGIDAICSSILFKIDINFQFSLCTRKRTIQNQNSRTKSRDCNGNNSETELPKNLAKRRQQSHFNVPSYRPTRRVNKTQLHKTFYANCGEFVTENQWIFFMKHIQLNFTLLSIRFG